MTVLIGFNINLFWKFCVSRTHSMVLGVWNLICKIWQEKIQPSPWKLQLLKIITSIMHLWYSSFSSDRIKFLPFTNMLWRKLCLCEYSKYFTLSFLKQENYILYLFKQKLLWDNWHFVAESNVWLGKWKGHYCHTEVQLPCFMILLQSHVLKSHEGIKVMPAYATSCSTIEDSWAWKSPRWGQSDWIIWGREILSPCLLTIALKPCLKTILNKSNENIYLKDIQKYKRSMEDFIIINILYTNNSSFTNIYMVAYKIKLIKQ